MSSKPVGNEASAEVEIIDRLAWRVLGSSRPAPAPSAASVIGNVRHHLLGRREEAQGLSAPPHRKVTTLVTPGVTLVC